MINYNLLILLVFCLLASCDKTQKKDLPLARKAIAVEQPLAYHFERVLLEQVYDDTSRYSSRFTLDSLAKKSCLILGKNNPYGPVNQVSVGKKTIRANDYLHCTTLSRTKISERAFQSKGSIVIQYYDTNQQSKHWIGLDIDKQMQKHNLYNTERWTRNEFWVKVPQDIVDADFVKIYIWNNATQNYSYFHDLTVELWKADSLLPKNASKKQFEFLAKEDQPLENNQPAFLLKKGPGKEFGPTFRKKLETVPQGKNVQVKAMVLRKNFKNQDQQTKFVLELKRAEKTLRWEAQNIQEKIPANSSNKWSDIVLNFELPIDVQIGDELMLYPWNPQGDSLYLNQYSVYY